MTLESWNLVFSAATAGMVLVGGIWLKFVVAQQLKTKDTTIEALNAAIKLHETEIAGLKGERAPAIAAEYKTMREYADKMTADKQELEGKFKDATTVPNPELLFAKGKAEGLLITNRIFLKHIESMRVPGQRIPLLTFSTVMVSALQEFNVAMLANTEEVNRIKAKKA